MIIQLLINKTGLIYGDDPKRIECDLDGTLTIGGTEISVKAKRSNILPALFYGASGIYDATFTTAEDVYNLGKVEVRGGRISSPPSTAVEFLKVNVRADEAEKEREKMKEDIEELRNIFDTNSLNFLIN